MNTIRGLACFAVVFTAVPLPASLATMPYHVEVTPSGSTIAIHLQDVDRTALKIDVPTTIEVEAVRGEVAVGRSEAWSASAPPIELKPGELIPPVRFRTLKWWYPDDVILSVTVRPEAGQVASSQITASPQPEWPLALIAAILGGIFWALVDRRRAKNWAASTLRQRAFAIFYRVSGAVGAGILAFAGAKIEPVWKLVGVNPGSFQVQTYFLLGLAVAALGVANVVGRLLGQQLTETPLTAEQVKTEVISVIREPATLRVPLREELHDALFSPDYIERYGDLVPSLQSHMQRALYGTPANDLPDYVNPRTDGAVPILPSRESQHDSQVPARPRCVRVGRDHDVRLSD